uniref:UV excision repair protein RAD23 n=1 Tax=Sexangularia sp. CB-2014 TaxID=1486929 RepID=A0A7S1VU05_9EUKA
MSISLTIKETNGTKTTVSVAESSTVLALKEAIASTLAGGPAPAQQRLIFSGHVLKDDDALSKYGIKDGHSIHLVKSRAPPSPGGTAATSPSASSNAASAPFAGAGAGAGAGDANPLAGLMGGAGGDNPLAGLMGGGAGGLGGMDPSVAMGMLQNPQVQASLQALTQNPEMLQQMMASNPMAQQMMQANPQMAALMQNPEAIQQMFNPQNLQAAMQMQQAMATLQGNMGGVAGGDPFAGFGGAPAGDAAGANPFAGANLFGAGAGAAPASAASTVPPEERFATQLTQLGEMGFTDREKAVQALLACNGNVQAAIERLLSM